LRTIAEMLGISAETVRRHWSRNCYVLNTVRWTSHNLTDHPKRVRVDTFSTLFDALRIQEHNQWHNIVTGDESWFYFEYLLDPL
jgi:hypothetical protein